MNPVLDGISIKLNYKLHKLNLIKIFVAINKTFKFKE